MFNLSIWSDPVFLGQYPAEAPAIFGKDWPTVTDQDLALISQPLDFIGYNGYCGYYLDVDDQGNPKGCPPQQGCAQGSLDWLKMTPEFFYWAARFQSERYGRLPFIITENGLCNLDWVALDGKVHDPQRIDFMQRYLIWVKRAIDEDIPINGYFYWSIMDNFEWAEGYKARFGLIHVDYETQKRTLKDSAYWYQQVIRTQGASIFHENSEVKKLSPSSIPVPETEQVSA
jgi:beta-glucosidase